MVTIIKMLEEDEGIRTRAYVDTEGHVTVGIGFNMDDLSSMGAWIRADIPESFTSVHSNMTSLSTDSIYKLLNVCIVRSKNDIVRLLPNFNTYPDYVQYALINLMFNLGYSKLSGFHHTLALIIDTKFNEAADNLMQTLWAKQVPARATRVCALLKGQDLYVS